MTEQKTHIIKKILLGITLILLALPLSQHILFFHKEKPLHGAIETVKPATMTMKNWLSGEYSEQTTKYIQHHFGFHNDWLRLDNQLAYSIFGEVRARNVIVGKNDYLYEKNYIDAYTGKDYIGSHIISKKVENLKIIQDSLFTKGKHLLIILAAGKASFYPEYIPNKMMLQTDSTNYKLFASELKKQGVHHIDFNAWFMANKGKKEYPLYPKTGIHWSRYGMLLAADSIINHIENFRDWDIPELYWDNVDFVDERREIDDDIEKGMNLMTSFSNFKMAYPHYQYQMENKDRPKVITISDSFFWDMYSSGIAWNVYDNGPFWYYFDKVYPESMESPLQVKDLDLSTSIKESDLIVMMATEGNLAYFPWNAETKLKEVLQGDYSFEKEQKEQKIQEMIFNIKNDEKWFQHIKDKAQQFNMPLDTILRKDALQMLEKKE